LLFCSYCRYIKCSDQAALIAVFTYLCNGYILNYCIAQNVFIELYILLPLLLLGTEKLQKEKKSGIYIACIAYLGISLLLNLYTMTLILAGYLCVRYVCREENRSF
jgi:Bacterial membrane protein YfhO.